jgi:hypothetical protein
MDKKLGTGYEMGKDRVWDRICDMNRASKVKKREKYGYYNWTVTSMRNL